MSDLNDLVGLAAEFRNTLGRSTPSDLTLTEHNATDFLVAWDEAVAVGYLQQRYRFSIWLGALEATLEDLFVIAQARRRGCRSQSGHCSD